MGTISLSIPQGGQLNSTEDPKIATDLTLLQTLLNGNLDGANVGATLTGRRMIGQATVWVPGSTATGAYFVAVDGTLVGTNTNSTKPLNWWYLDPANWAVFGKSNTNMILRIAAATNSTAPGASCVVGGQVNAVTFTGASGNIQPSAGGVLAAGGFGALSSNSAAAAESSAVSIPTGAYAPLVTITTAAPAANSVISLTLQLFALNS